MESGIIDNIRLNTTAKISTAEALQNILFDTECFSSKSLGPQAYQALHNQHQLIDIIDISEKRIVYVLLNFFI